MHLRCLEEASPLEPHEVVPEQARTRLFSVVLPCEVLWGEAGHDPRAIRDAADMRLAVLTQNVSVHRSC